MIDGDVLRIEVFSDWHKDASKAMGVVTKDVNAFLMNYPPERIVSVTPQVTEFTDPGWDLDGSAQVCRYTVTVVLKV